MRKWFLILLALCTLTIEAEQRGGYHVEAVKVPVTHGQMAEGYLLVPDRIPKHGCTAIIACHDHGARFTIGKEKLCQPLDTTYQAEAQAWVNKFYDGAFVADTLASRGYVVLVIDALYWGSRQPDRTKTNKELKYAQPDFYQQHLKETGEAWFETILNDDKSCVDYLRKRPEVNKKRIGIWGFSMGAYRAWQLAAEDKRIAFCAAANWMRSEPETGVSSWSMYRPSKDGVPLGTIAAKIAPRPMLLQYGTEDKLFPDPVLRDRQWAALKVKGIASEHRFTKEHLTNLLRWLKER